MSLEIRAHRDGATLRLAVRPGAQRTAVSGEHDGALKLAAAAPAEKGKANREALRFLAGELRLRRAQLELIGGEHSRAKVLLCRGLRPEELRARLAGLVRPEGG